MNKQPEALRLADRIDLKDYYEFDASLHCPKAAAELRRLHSVEKAFQQWITKTEWVQKSSQSHELGMHRADVMKQRLEQILIENQQLRAELDQPQCDQDPVAGVVIDGSWNLPSLVRVGSEDSHIKKFGGNRLYTHPQPQSEQEPVAWMVTSEMQDGTRSTYPMIGRFKDVQDCCDFGEPVPLIYQHPQPKRDLLLPKS